MRHLATLNPVERANFGNPTSAKRSFNRYVASGRPEEPDSVQNLIIKGTWASDQDGNQLLLHDNRNNVNRIIVFCSQRCLRYLAFSNEWFMDGTFKVCPTLFDQLYVIRAPLDESAISLVYALLPNRQEETYRELLQILQTKYNNINIALNLTNVMVDFELAMINALRHVFGQNMDISGCFFHLCQNTWKHIQELGLADDYMNDDNIKLWCGMIDGLAFLPEHLGQNGLRHLQQEVPLGFDPLLQYFERTYMDIYW